MDPVLRGRKDNSSSRGVGLLACVQVGGDHEHAQVALVPSGDLDILSGASCEAGYAVRRVTGRRSLLRR